MQPAGPVSVNPATEADVPALAALAVEHYGGDVAAWRERLAAPVAAGELVLVARAAAPGGPGEGDADGAAPVGYVRAGRRTPTGDDPAPAGWWLTGLVVAASARGRGVGSRLVSTALAHRPAGEPVWSMANATNAASLALHEAAGFAEVLRAPVLLGEPFEGGEGVLFGLDP
ncbi:GNAT family N-acetyltransferase [Aquipuribacter sp. SD81]|uniref:GNAT family N-acetyltransferase n=1 Tax=Aquipuribacter sp. SD81 TaxID=3127703 RepID=UPI0030195553